jgi:hypothetical protein
MVPQRVVEGTDTGCEETFARRANSANVVFARISIVASRTSTQVGRSERETISGQGSGLRRVA